MIDHSNALNLTLKYINELIESKFIYSISAHKVTTFKSSQFTLENFEVENIHFNLLVITSSNVNDPRGINNKINKLLNNIATVNLYMHSLRHVYKHLDENSRFFYFTIINQEPLYKASGILNIDSSYPFDKEADYNKRLDVWKRSFKKIEIYNNASFNSWEDQDIAIDLIAKIIKTACHCVIFVFLGYKLNKYHLDRSLELCDIINPHFRRLIPRITEDDEFNYKLISKAFWDGEVGESGQEPYVTRLAMRSSDFSNYVDLQCRKYLSIED